MRGTPNIEARGRRFPRAVLLARAVSVAVLALSLAACGSDPNATAKKIISAADAAQQSVATAFNDAKAAEQAAGLACGNEGRRRVATGDLPKTWTPGPAPCAAIGKPLPYDAAKLNALVGPVNAGYEAIRAANTAREAAVAAKTNPDGAGIAAALISVLSRLYTAASDLGLKVNADLLKAVNP